MEKQNINFIDVGRKVNSLGSDRALQTLFGDRYDADFKKRGACTATHPWAVSRVYASIETLKGLIQSNAPFKNISLICLTLSVTVALCFVRAFLLSTNYAVTLYVAC